MFAYARAKNATASVFLNWYRDRKCVGMLGNYAEKFWRFSNVVVTFRVIFVTSGHLLYWTYFLYLASARQRSLHSDCPCYRLNHRKVLVRFPAGAGFVSLLPNARNDPPNLLSIICRRLFTVDKYGRAVRLTTCMCASVENDWRHTSTVPHF